MILARPRFELVPNSNFVIVEKGVGISEKLARVRVCAAIECLLRSEIARGSF